MLRACVGSAVVAGWMVFTAVAAPAPDPDRHWSQWRGPNATGVAPHADPPVTWSEDDNVLFKVEIPGRGHASPVVWGDRIFLLTAIPTGRQAEVAEGDEAPAFGRGVAPDEVLRFVVLALDRDTGQVLWRHTAAEEAPHEGHHPDGTWASASAVTDGEHLIAHFGSRGIFAYDLAGDLKWSKDLGDMQTRHGFGEGSSPVIHGNVVVVNWDHQGDSFVVALDKASGAVAPEPRRGHLLGDALGGGAPGEDASDRLGDRTDPQLRPGHRGRAVAGRRHDGQHHPFSGSPGRHRLRHERISRHRAPGDPAGPGEGRRDGDGRHRLELRQGHPLRAFAAPLRRFPILPQAQPGDLELPGRRDR